MHIRIPCTKDLFISDNLQIVDAAGKLIESIPSRITSDGNCVEIELQNQKRWFSRMWLYCYARHQIPEFVDFRHVLFIPLPDFRDDLPYRAIFTKPYYYDATHRLVPMCTTLAISKTGELINIVTGQVCHQWTQEYVMVSAYRPTQRKIRPLRVHVLVANAWVMENQDSLHPICNHLDGNKFNPNYKNLEWTSYQENARHARDTGLTSSVVTCRLRNKNTGEIIQLPSAAECARFLGRSKSHLAEMTVKRNILYNGIYELRLAGDTRPWLYLPDTKVMNDASSRFIIWVTEDSCKRVFNGYIPFIKYYHLKWCNTKLKLLERIKDLQKLHPSWKVECLDQMNSDIVPIQVKEERSGKVMEFNSKDEISKVLNLDPSMIAYTVRRDGFTVYRGYRMRYKTDAPWPVTISKFKPIKIMVENLKTHCKILCESLGQTQKITGWSSRKVKRALKNQKEDDEFKLYLVSKESSTTIEKLSKDRTE